VGDKVYATGLTVESYSLFDMKQINNEFEFSKLNQLKAEETTFLK
jgi:hypothetical protein